MIGMMYSMHVKQVRSVTHTCLPIHMVVRRTMGHTCIPHASSVYHTFLWSHVVVIDIKKSGFVFHLPLY